MSAMSESEVQEYLFKMQKEAVLGSWTGVLNGCKEAGLENIPFEMIESMIESLNTTSREGFDYQVKNEEA